MSEIISELNNLHIDLRREDLDSKSSKEKDELQHNELTDSHETSTSCSNSDDGNYQGIKSDLIEKSDDSDNEKIKSERKHSAPTEVEQFFLKFVKIEDETRSAYYNKLLLKGLISLHNRDSNSKVNKIFIL